MNNLNHLDHLNHLNHLNHLKTSKLAPGDRAAVRVKELTVEDIYTIILNF